MEQHESQTLIRVEGVFNVTSAADMKRMLVEGLATGNDLLLHLESAEELDIAAMQLLWAVVQEAARTGTGISLRMPDAASTAAREAGFEPFPGLVQE